MPENSQTDEKLLHQHFYGGDAGRGYGVPPTLAPTGHTTQGPPVLTPGEQS